MTTKVTVAQLIEKLKTLPQDAEVEVLKEVISGFSTYTEHAPLDIEYGCEVFDYTDEKYKNSSLFGRKMLYLVAE